MNRTIVPDFSDVSNKHLLVAVSGGADSVALLALLHENAAKYHIRLTVAHIEHGIRGKASLRDCAYVRELCDRIGIPLLSSSVDVPTACLRTGEGMETVARRLRYDALRELKERCAADLIALAHHRGDQVETVLMHILRGCGLNGLSGMRRIENDLYRPLLDIDKSDLEQYLTDSSIGWQTDATNLIPDNPRNALRLRFIPEARAFYPGMEEAVLRLSETASIDNEYLESETDRLYDRHVETGLYGTRIVYPQSIPRAILRRILMRIPGMPFEHDSVLLVESLLNKPRGKQQLSQDCTVLRTPNALYLLGKAPPALGEIPLNPNGITDLGIYGQIITVPTEPVPVTDDPNVQVLDADNLNGATVRLRRNGDHIRPLGSGEKLLSDYMTDRKLDLPLRDITPLVARGSDILWAVGLGISDTAKLTRTTRVALRLEWRAYDNENN